MLQFRLATASVLFLLVALVLAALRQPPIVAAFVLTFASVTMFVSAALAVVRATDRSRSVYVGVAVAMGTAFVLRLGGDRCFPDGHRLLEVAAPKLTAPFLKGVRPPGLSVDIGYHESRVPDSYAVASVVASISTMLLGLVGGLLGAVVSKSRSDTARQRGEPE
jgi:hypothetical protein